MMTSTGPDSDAQKKDCWDSTKADLMSSLPVTQEDLDRAESHKTNANQLFAQKKFKDAVQEYTLAISYNPLQPTYYGNRAFAYIKQELYGAALLDANEAIALDPAYVKAYYRRAVAQMALGKLKEALADFKSVVKVAPRDRDALLKLKDCEKEFRRLEFEKAIAFEEVSQSALDLLGNIDEIHVEDS
jgi:serine/threonine-protein phosphatase 5